MVWNHYLTNKSQFHLLLNGKVLLEHRNKTTDLVEHYSPIIPKVFSYNIAMDTVASDKKNIWMMEDFPTSCTA